MGVGDSWRRGIVWQQPSNGQEESKGPKRPIIDSTVHEIISELAMNYDEDSSMPPETKHTLFPRKKKQAIAAANS